jgi:hypothetical protein
MTLGHLIVSGLTTGTHWIAFDNFATCIPYNCDLLRIETNDDDGALFHHLSPNDLQSQYQETRLKLLLQSAIISYLHPCC